MTQSQAVGFKSVTRAVVTAVIALVLAIAIFATSALADLMANYNVDIEVDGESFTITTNESQPIDILAQANITLGENDRLDISGFDAGKGGIIKVDKYNSINIMFAGNVGTYSVYADTVGEAYDELGFKIADAAKSNYDLDAKVQDGMVVEIKDAPSVTLKADGKTTKYLLTDSTVSDILMFAGVKLDEDDYTTPDLDTTVKSGMKVVVYRVEYKEETVKEAVDFKVEKKKDSSMYEGTKKVLKKGVKGEDEVTYKVKYVNGKSDSKEELDRKVIKKPVTQVEKVGTKKSKGASAKSNGVSSKGGFTVGQTLTGRYTHYCACGRCGTGSGMTASGRRVYNGMANPYYIACNWLPMGSVVSVNGTNYVVVDRGGSGLSRVGRIDIFTPQGHSAALRKGTGNCELKIVRLGW